MELLHWRQKVSGELELGDSKVLLLLLLLLLLLFWSQLVFATKNKVMEMCLFAGLKC